MKEDPEVLETYKPVWDNWSIVTTIICLIAGIALVGTGLSYHEAGYRWLLIIIGIPLFLCVFLFPYRVSLLRNRKVRLSFVGYSKEVDLKSLRLIGSGREFAKGAWRLFGSGGHFGYWGFWQLKDGRTFVSYLTNFSRNVRFLEAKEGKIIALNAPLDWVSGDE